VDIVTDNFDKMSINQIYSKLSSKYAQLNKVEKVEQTEITQRKDYIEQNTDINRFDEENFANVLKNFKQSQAFININKQIPLDTENTISSQSNLNKILLQLKGEDNAS